MAVYLVTGGAGFIGSHIAERLVKEKHTVKILDNFYTGKRENIAGFLDKVELIEGDIRNLDLLRKVTRGVDYISHQAALRSVPKSVEEPLSYNDVNVSGSLNLLLASYENKVKRVVCASSSSIYGDTDKYPEEESQEPEVISPYAATKLAVEHYCHVFSKTYGLETVNLRYFNVFGPRQDPTSQYAAVVPIFILRMLKGESPQVHGDGEQSRDFCYIDNVVDVNLLSCVTPDISGEVFNVAGGCSYSVLDIVNNLNEITGKKIKPEFTPPRRGDVRKTYADMTKLSKLLGYKPKVDFKEGLKRTVAFFK